MLRFLPEKDYICNAMNKLKYFLLIGFLLLLLPSLHAQGIKVGPWISDTGENSLTILWTSETPGMAWVELDDGRIMYETFAGRRIFRRLHSIKVEGLQRGSVVRYRVGGQNIKDDSNAYNPAFGDLYASPWYAVRTLDNKASSCRFSVFNDIHLKTKAYSALAAQVDSANTDFLFLNGDIVTAGNYELDTLIHYTVEPLGNLVHGLPLQYTRGNHEGRGNNTPLIADAFPHTDPAPFYYTFRQGPVAFIVFDAGETNAKRSALYSGAEVFEDYLNAQIEWARNAMREPSFRKAPVKVCLVHVPMIDHEDKTDYLLQRWLNVHVVPMLNKAGIDLMIGADLHEFMLCEPGTMGNDFPILVNDNVRRLEFDYTRGGRIHVSSFNASGEKEFERTF